MELKLPMANLDTTGTNLDTTGTAKAVRLERVTESAWLRALFYPYLGVMIAFVAWRIWIVNWHIWFGPAALAADLFSAVMMVMFLAFSRSIYLPVHRPADLSARVVDCIIATHREPVSLIEPTV